MSLTYTTWVDQLANMMVQDATDPNFVTFLPGCIDYAEQRMYRELDLLAVQDIATITTTPNTNFIDLSTLTDYFVIVEQMKVRSGNSVIPLVMTTPEFIASVYPNSVTDVGLPQYFGPATDTIYLLGPTPDAAYQITVIGYVRQAPLSASNPTTWLTENLPDVFFACSMIFATAYQRDFGAQADNPQSSESWEQQYQKLIGSATVQELRKRFRSSAWQSQQPTPIATPPRT